MYICREHKIAFIALPKNASRTVSSALAKIGGTTEGSGHHNIQPPTEDCRNFRAFAIVRNPFSRTVSKWYEIFKFMDAGDAGFRKQAFRAYVKGLEVGKPGDGWNKFHLSTQCSVLDAAQKHFDKPIKVVKYERLNEEWDTLFFRSLVGKLPEKKIGDQHGGSGYGDWRSYYAHKWVVDKVASIFYADLDRFGYPDKVRIK